MYYYYYYYYYYYLLSTIYYYYLLSTTTTTTTTTTTITLGLEFVGRTGVVVDWCCPTEDEPHPPLQQHPSPVVSDYCGATVEETLPPSPEQLPIPVVSAQQPPVARRGGVILGPLLAAAAPPLAAVDPRLPSPHTIAPPRSRLSLTRSKLATTTAVDWPAAAAAAAAASPRLVSVLDSGFFAPLPAAAAAAAVSPELSVFPLDGILVEGRQRLFQLSASTLPTPPPAPLPQALWESQPLYDFFFFFFRFFGEMWRPRFGTFRVFLEKKFGKKSVFFLEKSEKKVEEKKKDWQKNW